MDTMQAFVETLKVSMAAKNKAFGSRGILDRSLENTNPTCAHCSTICSGPLDLRREFMNLLFTSGIMEKDEKGREIVRGT